MARAMVPPENVAGFAGSALASVALEAAAMGATVQIRPDGTIMVQPDTAKPDDEFALVNMRK